MSLYRFFASDKEMPEFDNMLAVPIYNDDEPDAISFSSANGERMAMRINKEDDFYYASKFTEKKYINYIEWDYNDSNAEIIIKYINELLKDRFTVSLYNTWMNDKTPLVTTKVNITELTIKDIKNIWGQKFFSNNECLVVFKSF
jgi:hypothetical protein